MQELALKGYVEVAQLVASLLIGIPWVKGADTEVRVVHADALLCEVANLPLGVLAVDSIRGQQLMTSWDWPIRSLHP